MRRGARGLHRLPFADTARVPRAICGALGIVNEPWK